MNGKVIIGTKLSTSQLEKDLTKAEKDLNKFSKEEDKLLEKKQRLEIDTTKTENNLQKIDDKLELINKQIADMEQANLPENLIGNIDYQNLINQREELNRKGTIGLQTLELQKGKLTQINSQLENNRKKQDELNKSIAEMNKRLKLPNIEFDKTNKGLTKTIKNVAKWGLAIFGVRSAYMAVRSAMNVISQNDEQLKADIDYMKSAIAYTLEPVVRKIVELAKQLLFYIGYIIKMWTGKNIFENANKSLKNTNKSAKELRKTLAGFDEMNILNDDGSVGIGGISPSFDLTNLDFKVPKWLELIGKNKDIALGVISAITGALVTMKLLGLAPVLGILGAILGLGIYEFISGIIKMVKDPTWENFGQILEGLGITITSISAILAVIGVASGPIGWIMIAIGGLITLIGGLINELGKNKASIKDVEEANKDLKEAKDNLYNSTQDYTQAVKDEEQAHRKLIEIQKETGLSGKELYDLVESGKATYKDFNEQQRKVYDAYVNEQKAIGNVKEAEEKLIEARKIETQEAIESELANAKETESYDKLKESIVKAFREGKINAGEARDYLSRAMGDMSKDSKQTFMQDLPNDIKAGLDPHKYDSFGTKFKNWWNKLIKGLDTTIEITGVAKGGGGAVSFGAGSSGGRAKGGIYYPSKLPKLAVGGIINQPGRGVPYHGAYIGEKGAEAVVPLTDSQQMQLLGEAIGRYVTINANITNTMNGRVISRELQKVNNTNDFAFNK